MKKTEKYLLIALVATGGAGAIFFGVNQFFSLPLSEEEISLSISAQEFGREGQAESKALLAFIAEELDGKVDTSPAGMKVLSGEAVGCYMPTQPPAYGGQWLINALVIAEEADLSLVSDAIATEHPALIVSEVTQDKVMLNAVAPGSVSIQRVSDTSYRVELFSSCYGEQ